MGLFNFFKSPKYDMDTLNRYSIYPCSGKEL